MSDNSDDDNDLAKSLEKMLWAIGTKIYGQFKMDASQVGPDENGNISNTIKPMMKMAKGLFKTLLGQNFNSEQLSSLGSSFNQTFLDGIMKSTENTKDKSPIALAVRLLMNIGIPMLKNVISHAQAHQKKEENKGRPAEEGVNAKEKNTFHPRKRSLSVNDLGQHRQQANVVTPTLHRKLSAQK